MGTREDFVEWGSENYELIFAKMIHEIYGARITKKRPEIEYNLQYWAEKCGWELAKNRFMSGMPKDVQFEYLLAGMFFSVASKYFPYDQCQKQT